VWSPLDRNAKPADVAAAKSLGLRTIPWTVNERADMERLIVLGVDGLITDYPDRLRAVMAEKNIPLPPQIGAR
jgi:glycerophosphoryl diester phosphodiesterase